MTLRRLLLAYASLSARVTVEWAAWMAESIASIDAAGGAVTSSPDPEGYCRNYRVMRHSSAAASFGGGVFRVGAAIPKGDGPDRWAHSGHAAPFRPEVGDRIESEERRLRSLVGRKEKLAAAVERRLPVASGRVADVALALMVTL